jgi:methionyl-tRNA synthetase
VCPDHLVPVEWLEEENYFFKLSAFQERLIEWYESNPNAVAPPSKRNEALSFIKGGLNDISITRVSTKWGVPVPWDDKHVFYVWYDALINYLTAIGYGDDEARFEAWWPAVHHLIGKEIVRFHCVWWPAMCMAAGIDPPAHVQVHGWLLVGGLRLSKTRIREQETDPDSSPIKLTEISPEALTGDFGVDAIRYHLLRSTPLGTDGEFSYESITERYNSDLANNLGNLVARVATVVASKCGGKGPAPDPDSRLGPIALSIVEEVSDPWKAEPGPATDAVLGDALEALRIVALLIVPAMPSTSAEIWRRIGLDGRPEDCLLPAGAAWGGYPGGLQVDKGEPLFPRRKG